MIFYICNREKCEDCHEECMHTTDPDYAVNPDFDVSRFIKIKDTEHYWEEPNGSEGLRKYSD